MLLLYAHNLTPRLRYVADLISSILLEQPIVLTDDVEAFLYTAGPRISYHTESLTTEAFHIGAQGILFENDIKSQPIDLFTYEHEPAFFAMKGDIPFDLFGALFYLVSRYEEYLPHDLDSYGRFSHTSSLAFKGNFIDKPLINTWLLHFKELLSQKFPELTFKGNAFRCMITYDIDMAYNFKNKGFIRNMAAIVRAIGKNDWESLQLQWNVWRGNIKDPFDCFEELDALHLYCRIKPLYFFLVAKERGIYDKNISPNNKSFKNLIEYYGKKYTIGIHPSWKSNDDFTILKEEVEWLEVIAEKQIRNSRQHYLKMKLPETYRNLLQLGIEKDYTMGYETVNGFRASIASSFFWYDLIHDQPTTLRLYPFCFMDATCIFPLKQKPEEAYRELMHFYSIVKKHQGVFISIWHNNFLGTTPSMQGWRKMHELFMKHHVYWDAYNDEA